MNIELLQILKMSNQSLTEIICHYKTIATSFSKEAIAYNSNFPDIDFYICDCYCDGYNKDGFCKAYKPQKYDGERNGKL